MHSMFGNTRVCERTFSTTMQVTYKHKNGVADETLDHHLRLAPGIDEGTIVSEKPRPQASH